MGGRTLSMAGLGVAIALLALPCVAAAASLPPRFVETTVVDDLVYPTAVSFAPNGRIFVAEKSGLLKTFKKASDKSASVVADLRTEVHNFGDRGLLGLALDPRFPKKPHVYVLYTRDAPLGGQPPTWGAAGVDSDDCPDPPGATDDGCVASGRLARLTVDGEKLKRTKVLLDDWCQQYPSHSVGDLVFDRSGALYASGGDGASFQFSDYGQDGAPPNPCGDPPAGVGGRQSPPTAEGGSLRAQDLRTTADPTGLNGSVIRINPKNGAPLPGNPFGSSPDPNTQRILAYGLRNPFRLAVRPGTDEIWAGEVGSDYFDEIARLGTEANHGWPCFEGPSVNPAWDALDIDLCESLYAEQQASGQAVAQPWFAYGRQSPVAAGDGCTPGQSALSGLAFYPKGNFPNSYDGALFFADYARGCIWVIRAGAGGLPDPATTEPFVVGAGGPVDLERGPGGLYYVDIIGGALRRISYEGGNKPPLARLRASRTFGDAPLRVRFSASGSRDPERKRLRYSWDLDGDGRFGDSRKRRVEEVYRRSRPLTVSLRVLDRRRQRDTEEVRIFPGDTPPQIKVGRPRSRTRWVANEPLRFSGSARDREDGTLPARALDWELLLRHCRENAPCHTHPVQELAGTRRGSFNTPEHEYPSFLKLRVTATDSHGLAASRDIRLRPKTAKVTLQSHPSGLVLGLNDEYGPAPVTRPVIVGARFILTAPSPQQLNGADYEFQGWSDGGARSHETTANEDISVGATFGPSR